MQLRSLPTTPPASPSIVSLRTLPRPASPSSLTSSGHTRPSSPVEDDPALGAALFSPLWISLIHVVNDPLAMSTELVASIASENNPRPLRSVMPDNAEYWVTSNGEPVHIKFPAKIDRNGQFGRLGPYFNLPSTSLDIATLQKARAQFELIALDEMDTDCPPEALKCSSDVFSTLFALFAEVEDTHGVNATRPPSVIPFWRTYEPGRGDHYALIVTTEPLFKNLPNTNRIPAPKLSRADIGKTMGLLSPSKARAVCSARRVDENKGTSSAAGASGSRVLHITDLPDPYGRYTGIAKSHSEIANAKVATPEIRDRQGLLITPAEYDSKILDGDYVEVEIILKLWEIPANTRNNPNGSRIYQAILRNMKLLPFHSYSQAGLLGVLDPFDDPSGPSPSGTVVTPVTNATCSKGKRKAPTKGKRKADGDEELLGQSPSKKAVAIDDTMSIDGSDFGTDA